MKFFNNIIIQFTVFTFIVVFAASTILAIMLSKTMTEKAIKQHIKIYPEIVKNIVEINPVIIDLLNRDHSIKNNEQIAIAFTTLLNLETIFRIKIWDIKGEIIWSDKQEIIGHKFSDNADFLAAKTGKADQGSIFYDGKTLRRVKGPILIRRLLMLLLL